MSDQDEILAKLAAPFPPELIGKLPRITCGPCSKKQCNEHERKRCDVCSSYISERHIHIDYVGHADVTRRLLEADPAWDWDPLARDVDPAVMAAAVATGNPEVIAAVLAAAPPKYDLDERGNPVGLWIKLTVGGVTRPGYGSCPSNQTDAVKVLIGDALRNAAMRFGVALDLWAKGDRADPAAENATASAGAARRRPRQQARPEPETDWAWGNSFETRVAAVTTVAALRDLWDEMVAKHKAGQLTDDDRATFEQVVNLRKSELEGSPA